MSPVEPGVGVYDPYGSFPMGYFVPLWFFSPSKEQLLLSLSQLRGHIPLYMMQMTSEFNLVQLLVHCNGQNKGTWDGDVTGVEFHPLSWRQKLCCEPVSLAEREWTISGASAASQPWNDSIFKWTEPLSFSQSNFLPSAQLCYASLVPMKSAKKEVWTSNSTRVQCKAKILKNHSNTSG